MPSYLRGRFFVCVQYSRRSRLAPRVRSAPCKKRVVIMGDSDFYPLCEPVFKRRDPRTGHGCGAVVGIQFLLNFEGNPQAAIPSALRSKSLPGKAVPGASLRAASRAAAKRAVSRVLPLSTAKDLVTTTSRPSREGVAAPRGGSLVGRRGQPSDGRKLSKQETSVAGASACSLSKHEA